MNDDNLAFKLRQATHDSHRAAERAGVMNELLRGTLTLERYILLMANLREVYRALEAGLARQHDDPLLQAFDLDRLFRSDALDADLRTLRVGPGDAGAVLIQTRDFAGRIAGLSDQPELLLAHAYVRYLGDLNGGQTLSRLVQKSFPEAAAAVSFYQFGGPEDVQRLIGNFRDGLQSVPDLDGRHDRIIKEALAAFEFHRILFVTLADPEK